VTDELKDGQSSPYVSPFLNNFKTVLLFTSDNYIEQMSERTFLSSMGESMHSTFKNMIRISVAEGLKRMYKEYRLKKWLMVQEMANTVRRVLDGEEPVPGPHQGQLVHQGHLVYPEQHLHQ
jgi:hypothetical protein